MTILSKRSQTQKSTYLMRIPTSGVHGVVGAMNKFTRTAEVLWGKRDGMATL